MNCTRCNTRFNEWDSDFKCPNCGADHSGTALNFSKKGSRSRPNKGPTNRDAFSNAEAPKVHKTPQEYIQTQLGWYKESLIEKDLEESLFQKGEEAGYSRSQLTFAYNQYLKKEKKKSEKSLTQDLLEYLSKEISEGVLLKANRHQNATKKVLRYLGQDQNKAQMWLSKFFKKHNIYSEQDEKERIHDWLEDFARQKIKGTKYTKAQRQEMDSTCPKNNFEPTKQNDIIERWLKKNNYVLKKGWFW